MKIILILFIGFSSWLTFGQQLPQFSQFQNNQSFINPAACGAFETIEISMGSRYQWLGFSNDNQGNVAPRTAFVNGAFVLGKKKQSLNPGIRVSSGSIKNPSATTGKTKQVIGLQIIADEYGAFRNTAFLGTYAIHLPITKKLYMAFGIRAGLSNQSFLFDKAQVLSGMTGGTTDLTYSNFVANGYSRMFLTVNSGLFVYSNKFFIGLSGNQFTKGMVSIGNGITNFNPVMHFDLTAGMKFKVNQSWVLMPAISTKLMKPVFPTIQFNLQANYNEKIWAGIGLRYKDALIGMFGINVKEKFRIGYSFDYTTSRISNFTSGGHELILGFKLK